MNETTFLDQPGVTVTNTRFVVNGQTYAMSNVTSVKQGMKPASKIGSIVLIIIGLVTLAQAEGAGYIIPLLFLVGGILWWVKAKSTYSVLLSTSSGEAQALSSKDQQHISSIINALSQAIVHRG